MHKRIRKIAGWHNIKSDPVASLSPRKSYHGSVHRHLFVNSSQESLVLVSQEINKQRVRYINPEVVNTEDILKNKIWTKDSITAAVESVLFCSPNAITIDEISQILVLPTSVIWNAVDELKTKYTDKSHGIEICIKDEDLISFAPKENLNPYLIKIAMLHKRPRFSLAHKEVLALVAYKQPITRKEIEDLRGARSDHAIEKMLSYGLIQKTDETPARYTTTDLFAEVFGTRPEDLIPKKTDAIEVPLVI